MSAVREGFVRMSAHRLDPTVSYVYGISLPNVRADHPTVNSQQYEWDQFEIGDVDMTGLPVLANHKDQMRAIGTITAYEPLRGEARVLMGLDRDSFHGKFAEAAVTTGFYGSMSLSHHFKTGATVSASTAGATDVVVRKTALEVSLCQEPARAGAVVLEFCPSHQALLRQPRDYLRRFAERYRYPAPPDVPAHGGGGGGGGATEQIALTTPVLHDYVTHRLSPLVQERLTHLVNSAQFVRSEPILPGGAALSTTVDTGTVRMSSSIPGSASTPSSSNATPAATPASSSSMQVDTPAAATPASMSTSQSVPKAPSGGGSSNSMALDPPSQPASSSSAPKSTSTETTTRVDADAAANDPAAMMAMLHARTMAMEKQLEDYKARERAQREATEQETRRRESEKIKADELAEQVSLSVIAENLKMDAAQKQRLLDGHKRIGETAKKYNMPYEELQQMRNAYLETTVQASKRVRLENEEIRNERLTEQMRIINEQMKSSKSSATMHGGYSMPDDSGTVSASAGGYEPPVTPSPTPPSTPYPYKYGLTHEDYKRHMPAGAATSSSTQDSQQSEGKVDASKTTVGRNGARTGGNEISFDDPDAIGKAYASLCKLNSDGTVELPSYDEVACGGMVVEARVKRSADGAEQRFEVLAPRWGSLKKRIGLQHLFPNEFKEMQKPLYDYEAKLEESLLKKMATSGKGHAALNVIPPITSRRRKGNYQKNWFYCDPRRRGTEESAYRDIPLAEQFADGTPCY